ncbi:condensation domain-containing protein [Lysinibacillus xylanilyticus]|uniref:condensation domain-containing protein n=1 Tax=Lysinibacillus xylanilyticus TaxID=582475 RepID=UPI003825EAF1
MTKKIFPLSPLQLGIWSHIQHYGEHAEYEIPNLIRIEVGKSVNQIEEALNNVIKYNSALRVSIVGEEHPLQKIEEYDFVSLNYLDVPENFLEHFLEDFIKKPMSIKENLVDFQLFRTPQMQVLACKFHHIIADGQSVNIFEKELNQSLNGQYIQKSRNLYEVYLENINDHSVNNDTKLFWEQKLKQPIKQIDIPKLNLVENTSRKIIRNKLNISKQQLFDHSISTGGSIFSVSLGILKLFISRYFGLNNLAIGIPVSTRKQEDEMFGFMANVLPLVSEVSSKDKYIDYQKKIQENILNVIVNCDIPSSEIHKILGKEQPQMNKNPFVAVFDLIEENTDSLSGILKTYASKESEYNWIVNLIIVEDELFLESNFKSDYIPKWFIQQLHDQLNDFYMLLLDNPNNTIEEYSVLNEVHEQLILEKGNIETSTKREISAKVINFLPCDSEKISISYKDHSISYKKLNHYANVFSSFLQTNNIDKGAKFVVCCEDKLMQVILFYCIQINNCCYIPISSATPIKRIENIIKEANPLIIFSDFIKEDIAGTSIIRNLEELNNHHLKLNKHPEKFLRGISYIIFTSGSTGTPKGVPITFENINSLIHEYNNLFSIEQDDVVAQVASFSFDASLFEMTLAFSNGMQLAIFDETNGYETFPEFVQKFQVSHFLLTPDYYSILNFNNCNTLKSVIVGGAAYRNNSTIPENVSIYNAYGPSEASIMCSIEKINEKINQSSIGTPIKNSGLIILDEHGNPVPRGISGEIAITGNSVFPGYLNPNVESPFVKIIINKELYNFYRTSDIGYFDENWHLIFKSRKQNLVKIRGNRIDPEEIVHLALSQQGVKNAVTIVSQNNIFLFYVGDLDVNQLKEVLKKDLPSYMLPREIIKLEKIPLNINGKVDQRLLTEMVSDLSNNSIYSHSPNSLSEIENIIIETVKQTLNIDDASLESNFYSLGGDSIISIQLANKFHEIGINITSLDIMKSQSLGELCEKISDEKIQFDQRPATGEIPLLPIQKWFFNHTFSNINHWNQSEVFKVSGNLSQLDFLNVYREIRAKHDSLRSLFTREETYKNTLRDNNEEDLRKEISFFDYTNTKTSKEYEKWRLEILNNTHKRIDIQSGFLSQIAVIKMDNETFEVIWVCHHLITDNVSWMILKNDFLFGIECVLQNKPIRLSEKTTNINDWSKYIKQKITNNNILSKWHEYLPDKSVLKNGLPPMIKEPFITTTLSIDTDLTEKIKTFSEKKKISIDLLLFLIFSRSLAQCFSLDETWITRELNGRTHHPKEIQLNQTVGWFTSMHPVKAKYFEDMHEFISMNQFEIKKMDNVCYEYQFLEPIMELPNISYNYLGNFPNDFEDETLYSTNLDINSFDFFDAIALNVGRKNDRMFCVFISKNSYKNTTDDLSQKIIDNIKLLFAEKSKTVFGISSNTLIELNDLF